MAPRWPANRKGNAASERFLHLLSENRKSRFWVSAGRVVLGGWTLLSESFSGVAKYILCIAFGVYTDHTDTQTHTWLSKRWHHTPLALRHFVLLYLVLFVLLRLQRGGQGRLGETGTEEEGEELEPPATYIPVDGFRCCSAQRFCGNWDSYCPLYDAQCLRGCAGEGGVKSGMQRDKLSKRCRMR